MPAAKAALLLAFLLLTAPAARGAQADPHELLDRARAQMKRGDLDGAYSTASALRDLITRDRRWDPDRTFSRQFLPSLEARLERLKKISRDLDAFNARGIKGLKSPKTAADFPTVKQYTAWTTSLIQQMRRERDRIVEAGVMDQEDRASIARTSSYAASEKLLQTDLLKKVSVAAGDDMLGILSGDSRMETVLLRFRQIKLDLVQVMSERDALAAQLNKTREREKELRQLLAAGGKSTNLPLAFERLLLAVLALTTAVSAGIAVARGRALNAATRDAALPRDHAALQAETPKRHDAA